MATATSVVLQNNGGDNLTVGANGAFTFATGLISGATYNVTVQTQPAGQTCSVANGSGTVAGVVSNIAVSCVAASAPPPPTTIASVPTLGEWGLMLLGGLLALVGVADSAPRSRRFLELFSRGFARHAQTRPRRATGAATGARISASWQFFARVAQCPCRPAFRARCSCWTSSN